MGDKIFKLTLQNLGHYEIRLLPNINDLKNLKISFKAALFSHGWIYNHICYALVNGEIKVIVVGDVVMRSIKTLGNDDPKSQMKIWDLKEGFYFDINTSEQQGFLKVDVDVKEDKKYSFDKDRKHIVDIIESFRHNTLEDSLYPQLFRKAEIKWKDNYMNKEIYMKEVYEKDYPDFKERYNVYLRRKKLKKIMNDS